MRRQTCSSLPNQGQDEAEHQQGEETRSSIKMVDRNNGSVKVVSLSDIFSSSGALPFIEEREDSGVFIPERTSVRGRGGRLGGYVIVHREANKGKRRFDDELCGWTDDQGRRHIQMPEGCTDDVGNPRWMTGEEESEEGQQVYQVRESVRER